MTLMRDSVQILLSLTILTLLTPPLGKFMERTFQGTHTVLTPLISWLERFTYRLCGIDPFEEMRWQRYLGSLLAFNGWGFVTLFSLQLQQDRLPGNP